jgi:hypothetical protein
MTGSPTGVADPHAAAGATPVTAAGVALEWSFNPWRDRPLAAVAAALMTLALCLVIGTLREPPLVRAILGLAILGTLSPALSPARCRVDEQGVAMQGPFGIARRRWSDLKRVASRPAGVLVSPYARPHWLDAYRGLLLPVPKEARDALLAELRGRLVARGL